MVCHYIFTCGTAEKWLYAPSDTIARRRASRWIRLFWERFRAQSRAGSMADSTNNAWHSPVTVDLYRAHVDSAGIIAATHARIDGWELAANAEVLQWCARKPRRKRARKVVLCDKCERPNDQAHSCNYCSKCRAAYQAHVAADPETRPVGAVK